MVLGKKSKKKKTEKNPEESSLENPSKNLSISLCENWLKLKWELLYKFETTNKYPWRGIFIKMS